MAKKTLSDEIHSCSTRSCCSGNGLRDGRLRPLEPSVWLPSTTSIETLLPSLRFRRLSRSGELGDGLPNGKVDNFDETYYDQPND